MPEHLLAFLALVTILTVTPGPDMALGLRNGVRGGARATWWTGLGCCAGLVVHACAAVLGLSALLAASAGAYTAVKIAGALYLVYLGLSALWHSRPSAARAPEPDLGPAPGGRASGDPGSVDAASVDPAPGAIDRATAFQQGLLSNLLNPKIAVLFLSLLPQFVSPAEPRLLTSATLAAVFLAVALLWWRIYSLLVGSLGRVLVRRRVRAVLERVTGTVLVALGVRVAVDASFG